MISPAWAQAASGGAPSPLVNFMPLILIFVVFYFLLIRPQQQKQKEQQKMLENLKLNDEVTTSGGIYGKIVGLTDRIVTLEIAQNVRIRVERSQIGTMVKGGPAEKNQQKEKDKPK
jgi:preprotein translocase subunit YajC